MPTEILMPALSPTMEEGKLAKWLVKEGQTIKPGDIIAEIETDKATMEVEAVDEGKVSKLLISEGTEGVKVNTPIAVLLAEGEKEGAPTVAKAPSPPAVQGTSAACAGGCRALSGDSPSPLVAEASRGGGIAEHPRSWLPPPLSPPHIMPKACLRHDGEGKRAGESSARYAARPERPRPRHRLAAGAQARQGGGARSGGAHR